MIASLAWRLGCWLVSWAVKRDGATSVRIDARYGETEIDWGAEFAEWAEVVADMNPPRTTTSGGVTWTNQARWN